MARKLKEMVKPDDNAMLDAVCSSAHEIWQAGLGAFAKAQKEGGDMFDKLVQDGVELQKLTQRLTGDKGFSVTDTVSKLAGSASRQASGSWDKLEKIFEERVARSLRSIGVPSQHEINGLSQEMADLKASLREVGQRAQDQIGALSRGVAELKDAIASAETRLAPKRPAAKPAAKAAAKPPAKAAKAVKSAKAPAKPAAKRTSVKSSAAKKQARASAGAS